MLLTPREQEALLIYVAANLARTRRERGLKLNYPESVALISEAMMEAAGVHVAEAPYARDSIAISGGTTFTELGAFKKGLFFVRDPAATLVTEYAAIPTGATVADLCAAPGGKALELSRTAGAVIASDKSFGRLQRLLANQRRLESTNILPFVGDARQPATAPRCPSARKCSMPKATAWAPWRRRAGSSRADSRPTAAP